MCGYCHFHEKENAIKEESMDVIKILDNITSYIDRYDIPLFKIGFVGNGEPLIEYKNLKLYIERLCPYIKEGKISAYTITNGLLIDEEKLSFFKDNKINVGFSIDGIQPIHDKWRCGTHKKVIEKIELFYKINGHYPTMNCTVGKEVLENTEETIKFFERFDTRITFSRMIGKYGISMDSFLNFMDQAEKSLKVRRGGYDCTMYGGKCGAGMDNIFYANGKIFICGNCVDINSNISSDTSLDKIFFNVENFDRTKCYKESILRK